MTPAAYTFVRTFPRAPARELCVDRHYLLCASAGALRLEGGGQSWLLPPARAALIEAGRAVRVSIPQPVTTASVLFDPAGTPSPPAALTVFDLSPLAGALLAECAEIKDSSDGYGGTLFTTLAAVTWRLAERPSPVVVPAGSSPELRRALRLTEERLGEQVRFERIAELVGLAPRSLARRFSDETRMTWREVLRRMRVLRAVEELAAGDTPVTRIAFAVGYTSLSAFNAAFRQLTGRTPTEYRASFRP
ncbi:AraC family transcriptional regulator [Actinoplanes sp. NPDC023936]|uniref:AraC family transcriptional regulator n=1 Tax=Actinoplanes sp. NPDC023936 TaxID=3154910 RepID=UPI0033E7D841